MRGNAKNIINNTHNYVDKTYPIGKGVWTGRENTIVSGPINISTRGRSTEGKGTWNIKLATNLKHINFKYFLKNQATFQEVNECF